MAPLDAGYSGENKSLLRFDENLCLCAGAGSGKTRVLVNMYLALIAGESSFNEPVPVEQIVAITFTEKAAAEMKSRVREAIGQKLLESHDKALWEERLRRLERAHIKTIHGFCAGLLREYAMDTATDPAFTILDEYEASQVLERIVHEVVMEGLYAKDPMVHKLICAYGFSGYPQVGGLKDFLKRVYLKVYPSGLHWNKINQMREAHHQRATVLLSSSLHSLSAHLEELIQMVQEGAIKKSAKSFSCIEELIRRYQTVIDIPEDMLIARGEAFLPLEDQLGSAWPAAVREIRKNLKENMYQMKSAYYQLLSYEYLDGFQQLLTGVDQNYKDWKRNRGVLDFDDLQIKTRDILKSNKNIRRELKKRFKVIMIDEFQDTNGIQKEIMYYLSEDLHDERAVSGENSYQDVVRLHPKKLCMVGDPKQSIYRFRGADVAVFLEMQSELEEGRAKGKMVSFSRNYRSQKGIVEFSNRFFSFIMGAGRERYEVNFNRSDHQEHQRQLEDEGPRVELITIARGKGSEQKRKIEASAISRRILEMVQPQSPVAIYERNDKGGEKRKSHPDFRDIAILFRRFTHIKLYERELRRRNIPYYVVKGRGFFGCQEIKDILNFLKYLDGENDDSALVGILRSPLVGVSDETLYRLFKGVKPEERPLAIAGISNRYSEVKSEITAADSYNIYYFINLLKQLRDKKDRLSPAELIERILAMTHYNSIMLTTFLGEQKVANVRKLIELSRTYSRGETSLLRDFIAYLFKLVNEDSIEPEAHTYLEDTNVVKLMTIHQAKGLEFPVVFIPDTGHSLQQGFDRVLFDESKGIALKLYQESQGTYESTLVHTEIAQLDRHKEYAESKRLFYVAATRARDYLVLSGEKPVKSMECWREWLDQFIKVHSAWIRTVEEEDFAELSPPPVKNLYQLDSGYQKLMEVRSEKNKDTEELASTIVNQSCFYRAYPSGELHSTVTALSEYMICPRRYYYTQYLGLGESMTGHLEESSQSFLKGQDDALHSNLKKGNLAHFILKHLNFKDDVHKKEKEIDALIRNQEFPIKSDEAEKLKKNILAFLRSDSGMRLAHSKEGHIYREIPLVLKLRDAISSLVVVLQGVIDLLYRDAGGMWTVVDYKYSAGREIDRERYKAQLMMYGLAVAKMMRVDEVKVMITVLAGKETSPGEWYLKGNELKNIEQRIIARAREIAEMHSEGAPAVWISKKEKDCRHPDCVYKKRCAH